VKWNMRDDEGTIPFDDGELDLVMVHGTYSRSRRILAGSSVQGLLEPVLLFGQD
jgi:hypothetical protein